MRYLSKLKPSTLRGKTCLLRVDFNIENPDESYRLQASLPTLHYLARSRAKIVILAHRGRPKNDLASRRNASLRITLPFLRKNFGNRVQFFNDSNFAALRRRINAAKPNAIILLENLRFFEGEETNDQAFAKSLASLGNLYVNDAFSVCHRKNASVVHLPRYLPSFAGLLLGKELAVLGKFLKTNSRSLIIILGGAKASDKIGVMKHFLRRARTILLGGVPANTFLKAKGFDIENSHFEPKMISTARRLLRNPRIVLPVDFIAHGGRLLDIGPRTAKLFRSEIRKGKTIFWNGPMGLFENKKFRGGSEAIARAIVGSPGFSIAGGGETTQLIIQLKLERRFGFLSAGGGAMLEYLSGKELPGIKALQ